MKDLSKDGKRAAVQAALIADPEYDENPIPITPQLLKMIVDKEFTGDDDTTTAAGAMKGLSIYLMEDMTDEEIPSRLGLIHLTLSLYGTLLLVYFVLAILTILFPSEPIKCSKEAVCQLRPCFMVLVSQHILAIPLRIYYFSSSLLGSLLGPLLPGPLVAGTACCWDLE